MSAAERRQAILDAALPLFAAHGRLGVTTKQIADACQISEALIYRHFESKEALFEALQGACVNAAEKEAQLDGLQPSTSSLVFGLYWLFRWILVGGPLGEAQNGYIRRLLLASLLDDGAFARGFYAKNTAPLLDRLLECLQAAADAGDVAEGAEISVHSLWRAYCCAAGLATVTKADPPVIDTTWEGTALVVDTLRFALLGLGLRPDAIARHLNPEAIALLERA